MNEFENGGGVHVRTHSKNLGFQNVWVTYQWQFEEANHSQIGQIQDQISLSTRTLSSIKHVFDTQNVNRFLKTYYTSSSFLAFTFSTEPKSSWWSDYTIAPCRYKIMYIMCDTCTCTCMCTCTCTYTYMYEIHQDMTQCFYKEALHLILH